jgi:zinc protease
VRGRELNLLRALAGALTCWLMAAPQRAVVSAIRRPVRVPAACYNYGVAELPVRHRALPLMLAGPPFAPPRMLDWPPSVPPPKPLVLPLPKVSVLENGLRVITVERHSLPIVTAQLVVTAGAEADPPGRPGTAQFVASMLDEGTADRTAQQIAAAIDQVGGTMDTGADWDDSFAAVSVLTDYTDLAFDLLADITLRPAFAPAEIERIRKQTLSALEVLLGDPSYLADAVLRRLIFAGTPYSHPADGTPDAVRQLTAQDLQRFHSQYYVPSRAFLIVVGDMTPAESVRQARRCFGAWRDRALAGKANAAPSREPQQNPTAVAPRPHTTIVVDKPDAVQTEIRVGNPGVGRANPDYDALSVANQILGGPASNRLFSSLRSQRGLSYSASSELVCYRDLGSWEVKTSTRTSETVEAVRLVLQEMKRLRDHPLGDADLKAAQDYLIGHRALEFETAADVASQVMEFTTYGLPLEDWNRAPQRIQSLSKEAVSKAVQHHLDPDGAVIVLVGNAGGFQKDLKKLGPARVIPIDRLDLAGDGLERAAGAR